ncbi:MAG: homocysteine S-methyltransferase family protein [Clostridia bacterium]|nr:homocysteine S-methyltransferase family protein [Clostridia bacterium]
MRLCELLKKEFVILDGALGTELQKSGMRPGELTELMCFNDPEAVKRVHLSYAKSGSDVVYANTFGANRYKLQGSAYSVDDVVREAVKIAKCAEIPVALDVGPLGRLLMPYGDLSFDEAYEAFSEVVKCGEKYGADFIVIETMTDLFETKAALLAAKENTSLEVLCSLSFEQNGKTFLGCGAGEAAITLSSLGADAIGVNCSNGPAELVGTVKEILAYSNVPVAVKPNAGLPDPVTGEYSVGAAEFASLMKEYALMGVKLLGGCCGTTPDHISKLKETIKDLAYVPPVTENRTVLCSFSKTIICDKPVAVGERINPTGKKLVREALSRLDFDYIITLAAEQIDSGADILDVNVGLPGADEKALMLRAIEAVQSTTDAPIQIDSSDPDVIEAALRVCRGKPIVNSVNGTEESLSRVLPLVKKYGAAVIGLALDENGIPEDAGERYKIAKRIVERAESIGINKRDIIIDCLTLTVSADQTAAKKTLDALRMVKDKLGVKTTLGVSNVSFGLPDRETVNAAFLVTALNEGLDFAIINPNSRRMMSAFRASNVLSGYDIGASEYISFSASGEAEKVQENKSGVTLDVAIERGMRAECERLTGELLLTSSPLDIVNGVLIPILDGIGDRYEKGVLYLPQLIMAADTVGVCFAAVKRKMAETSCDTVKGDRIILATVKGDIHDIGKSIVKVLLENYGYDVIDLGRDVPPETVLRSAAENDVKLVGLSALMTTTLGSMETTVKLLKKELPGCKVMVGGAVLTPEYAESIGADYYSKDAKGAVDIAKKVFK